MFCLIRTVVSFAKFTIPSQGEVKGVCDDMGVLPKIQRLGLMQVTGYIKSNQLRDNRFLVQWLR